MKKIIVLIAMILFFFTGIGMCADKVVVIPLMETIEGPPGPPGPAGPQGPPGPSDNLGNHTATTDLNMSSGWIYNLADPSVPQDAATKNYVDTHGDNMGDHMADQNVSLEGWWLSGDGGYEGLFINNDGNVGIGTDDPTYLFTIRRESNDNKTGMGMFHAAGDQEVSSVHFKVREEHSFDLGVTHEGKFAISSRNGTIGAGSEVLMIGDDNTVAAPVGGFKFPDDSVQTTAAEAYPGGYPSRLIHQFPVASGSISAGDVVGWINGGVKKGRSTYGSHAALSSADPALLKASRISASTFVLAYQDMTTSKGMVVAGQVSSGNIVSFGTPAIFHNASVDGISITALSETRFVVCYEDWGSSYEGKAIIGNLSGTTITIDPGLISQFHSDVTSFISVAPLSATHFVVAYHDDNGTNGYAQVGQITAPATIAWLGTVKTFGSGQLEDVAAATFSSTEFVVAYRDLSSTNQGYAQVGTIDGAGTIDFKTQYQFTADTGVSNVHAKKLDSNRFLIGYVDTSNNGSFKVKIGQKNDLYQIIFGPAMEALSNADPISIDLLSPTRIIFVHRASYGTTYKSKVTIGELSGNTLTLNESHVFFTSVLYSLGAVGLSANQITVAYIDSNSPSVGYCFAGQIANYPVGIAAASDSSGIVPVIIHGISGIHSGLTPGAVYYTDDNGDLTSDYMPTRIGTAVSATEIILD